MTRTLSLNRLGLPSELARVTAVVIPPGIVDPAASTVESSAATTPTGTAVTITVTVVDTASGAPVVGATVVLSASGTGNTLTQPGAVTDANGVATGTFASSVAEAKTISATADGTALTDTAVVTVEEVGEPGAVDWAFDPAASGYANIVNREFSTKAADNGDRGTGSYPDRVGGSEGWDGIEFQYPKLTIQADATAPLSPSGVMRSEFTAGEVGSGTTYSPGTMQTLSFTGGGHGSRTDTEVYFRTAFRLSSNWQAHPNGSSPKLMFMRSNGSPRVDNVLNVLDSGADFVLGWNLQGSALDGREQLNANMNIASAICALDTWVRVEVRCVMNTLGAADGILQVWKDGVLVLDYSDIVFLPTTVTQLYWDAGHFNSNWGGQGGTITETMYLYWDAVYFWGKA